MKTNISSYPLKIDACFRCLGGGNSNILYFHPEPCKNGIQFDEHIVQKGLVQPPTRCIFPIFGGLKWSFFPPRSVDQFPPEVSAFRAELKLGDFGWAAIAAPEGKVSKPPPTGEGAF